MTKIVNGMRGDYSRSWCKCLSVELVLRNLIIKVGLAGQLKVEMPSQQRIPHAFIDDIRPLLYFVLCLLSKCVSVRMSGV